MRRAWTLVVALAAAAVLAAPALAARLAAR